MKKLYLLIGFAIVLFTGCENDKYFTSFSSASDLEGIWVRVDEVDNCAYSYVVHGDKLIYRDHEGHIDKDNYFVCTSNKSWDDLIKITVKYEFDKEEQQSMSLA